MKEIILLILFLLPTIAFAIDFNQSISDSDKATFDEILKPVMKVYNLVKYVASAIAVLVLLFAGINYMISGSNQKKRDDAKNMAMYVIVGLVIIWVAPLLVNFITGG